MFTEKCDFLGGFMKNQYIGGDYLKKGTWSVCRFKGGLARKRVGFLRGVDTLMHTVLDKMQEQVCWRVGPALAVSLES